MRNPAVVQLASAGLFVGAVLDAGCGTGDNALCIAARGGHVFGFDVAPTAVSIAREHEAAEGLDAEFAVADALVDTVQKSLKKGEDVSDRLRKFSVAVAAREPGATRDR